MSRRLISGGLLGLALTVAHASLALGDHGRLLEGETSLSGGSVLLALLTSVLTGLVCYALMVWDPNGARK